MLCLVQFLVRGDTMKYQNYQLKITVSSDEKRRIERLAKLRFLTVPQYIRLSALGVKVQQVKEIFVESENPQQEEKLIRRDNVITLSDDDKTLLEDILERSNREGYIRYDVEFNKQLQDMARRLLGKENQLKS